MAYGTIKVDTITFTDSGVDKSVSISGLVQNPTFSGNITVTGTVSGNTIQGQTISGVTVTGTTANFTSGNFTNISGGRYTITSGVFAAGSAAAPSISFVSDPNSGLYSPGADQVAISTNGTQRILAGSGGNVGIGPSTSLDARIDANTTGTDSCVIRARNDSTSVYLDANNGYTYLNCFSNHPLLFGTNNTERMRLDSSGRLGLGSSSPSNTAGFSQQLEVAGNLPCVSISNTGTGANKYSLGVNGVGALGFWDNTASAFRMYINSSGSVGIGNTAPNRKLEVSDASIDNFIRVNTTGATKSGIEFASGGTVYGQLYFNNVSPYDLSLLQQYTTGSLILGTNSTERARIDTSGRLLVGTSSYTGNSKFAILGGAGVDVALLDLRFGGSRPTGADSGICEIRFGSPDQTSNNAYAKIECITDGASSSNTDLPARLVFSTTADGSASPSERLRIDSTGYVGVNVTNPAAFNSYFTAASTSASKAAGVFFGNAASNDGMAAVQIAKSSATNTSSQVLVDFWIDSFNTASGRIVANGASSAAFASYSDIRLKDNIQDLPGQLANICNLRPVEFDYKDGSGHQIGFIAQEVQQVYPDVVATGDNDMLTLTGWSKTEARLVKALQEAVERIETLEAKVAALEAV